MSSNREDTLRQFCDVTGADESRSRFFLESSNWQLEVALSSFYEHGGNQEEGGNQQLPTAPIIPVLSDSDMDSPPVSPGMAIKKDKKPKRSNQNQNFATLSSLQQESSSDEEEGQAFYAGGSERSGQQIIGPGKSRNDIVAEMFRSVRQRGAVVFDDEPSSTRGGGAFTGTGYRLGQTADDHAVVTPQNAKSQDQSRAVRLRLYREGFTVDDGALRPYTDVQNAEFLNSIRRGEIPGELSSEGEVRVSLEDRRHETYVRNTNSAQPFGGKGHMLGSPTPPTVGATVPVTGDVGDKAANERAAQDALALDETEPVTTIQIRLADGTRLSGRFNHSHTIQQIRQYITTAAPQYQVQNFVLMTTFPSAELSDLAKTVKQANLLNSVIVQRVK